MAMYTIAEVVVILALVMPMPSNALRGKIQGGARQKHVGWHVAAGVPNPMHRQDAPSVPLSLGSSLAVLRAIQRHEVAEATKYALNCQAFLLAVSFVAAGAINKLWHSQEYVKKTSWVLLTLNS
jgi:hypothetical protein